ncbi:hypothetical protein CC86DRAFT_384694 [Ophiobolus disseminans]|uniref:Uncharacterized protein n=1 Tax=Ophiobolus disseminans TaxID=1469910 RepID=A0A6A6ZRC0_9PLEO|nr:hypothetical protein CC86DRAFT_384694 [Ophiobolus disseminans]
MHQLTIIIIALATYLTFLTIVTTAFSLFLIAHFQDESREAHQDIARRLRSLEEENTRVFNEVGNLVTIVQLIEKHLRLRLGTDTSHNLETQATTLLFPRTDHTREVSSSEHINSPQSHLVLSDPSDRSARPRYVDQGTQTDLPSYPYQTHSRFIINLPQHIPESPNNDNTSPSTASHIVLCNRHVSRISTRRHRQFVQDLDSEHVSLASLQDNPRYSSYFNFPGTSESEPSNTDGTLHGINGGGFTNLVDYTSLQMSEITTPSLLNSHLPTVDTVEDSPQTHETPPQSVENFPYEDTTETNGDTPRIYEARLQRDETPPLPHFTARLEVPLPTTLLTPQQQLHLLSNLRVILQDPRVGIPTIEINVITAAFQIFFDALNRPSSITQWLDGTVPAETLNDRTSVYLNDALHVVFDRTEPQITHEVVNEIVYVFWGGVGEVWGAERREESEENVDDALVRGNGVGDEVSHSHDTTNPSTPLDNLPAFSADDIISNDEAYDALLDDPIFLPLPASPPTPLSPYSSGSSSPTPQSLHSSTYSNLSGTTLLNTPTLSAESLFDLGPGAINLSLSGDTLVVFSSSADSPPYMRRRSSAPVLRRILFDAEEGLTREGVLELGAALRVLGEARAGIDGEGSSLSFGGEDWEDGSDEDGWEDWSDGGDENDEMDWSDEDDWSDTDALQEFMEDILEAEEAMMRHEGRSVTGPWRYGAGLLDEAEAEADSVAEDRDVGDDVLREE